MIDENCFIKHDDVRWQEILKLIPHDIYHTPGYAAVCAQAHNGEALAYIWRKRDVAAIIPLVVSRFSACDKKNPDDGIYDAVSPYGYSGPISTAPGLCEKEILEDFARDGRQQGLVTAFLRGHPSLESAFLPFENDGSKEVGITFGVTLDRSSSDILSSYRSANKRSIKKLLKDSNLSIELNNWNYLPAFVKTYHQNMNRLNAQKDYFFEHSYFEGLREKCKEHVHLLTVVKKDSSEFLGGVYFFECNGIVQYHLPACLDEWRDSGLPKLLIHEQVEWGIRNGAALFHLGGGLGGKEDSLSYFKSGFSDKSFPYRIFRLVLDSDQYKETVGTLLAQLVKKEVTPNQQRTEGEVTTESNESYFPRYRDPLLLMDQH
jgi:hypothetical protein